MRRNEVAELSLIGVEHFGHRCDDSGGQYGKLVTRDGRRFYALMHLLEGGVLSCRIGILG
jgi:hypothetical protein